MAILIHPSSSEEQTLLENLLNKMQVSFERKENDKSITVSNEEMESISRGLQQAKRGEFTLSDNVHNKARLLCEK